MRRNVAVALLVLAPACVLGSEERRSSPLGGEWRVDSVWVTGPEQTVVRTELFRGVERVDDWLEEPRWYAPDCVLYRRQASGWYAVCGDRTPVRLPDWVLELQDDRVRGGYVTVSQDGRTRELWEMTPIDTVLAAARERPPFRGDWRERADTLPAALPKLWTEGEDGTEPVAPPPA